MKKFLSSIGRRLYEAITQVTLSKKHESINNPQNSTDGDLWEVDRVYLINLKRRIDRLVEFDKNYENSDMKNISYKTVEAVDGSTIDVDQIPLSEVAKTELQQVETTGFRQKHYQLTKGAIGCYLSHVKVWRSIINDEIGTALVFEDDAKVPPNMRSIVRYALTYPSIPNDWDIILLGFTCTSCDWDADSTYSRVDRFFLTHCYLIRSSAIEKIVGTDTLFPITQQIDGYLSELSSIINIYTIDKKNKVKQNNSRTDIQIPLINNRDPSVSDRMNLSLK